MTLSPALPFGFDISGSWALVEDDSDASPDADAIGRKETTRALRKKDFDPVASLAFAVQDFPVLASDALVIEHDTNSMGISYSNGTYQDLTWGTERRPDQYVRVGWNGNVLVINTKRKRIEGNQQWMLSDDAETLSIRVKVKTPKDKLDVVRTYSRL